MPILQENELEIATFNRSFRKKWIYVLSNLPIPILSEGVLAFLGKRDVEGSAKDGEEIKILERPLKENLLKVKWDIHHINASGRVSTSSLKDISKIKPNGRFSYQTEDEHYMIEKDFMNRFTYIKKEQRLMVEIERVNALPRPCYQFHIKEDSPLTPLEISTIVWVTHMQMSD